MNFHNMAKKINENTYLDTFIKIIQNLFISDMYKGCVGDMGELGITESLSVKRQVIIRQVQYCNDSSKFINLAERHI